MSDKKDEKKELGSDLTSRPNPNNSEKNEEKMSSNPDDEMKYGVMILTNELMTKFKIIEKFTHEEKEFELPDGGIFTIAPALAAELDTRRLQMAVSQAITNTKVAVKTPIGVQQINFPNFLAALTAEKVDEVQMKRMISRPQGGK